MNTRTLVLPVVTIALLAAGTARVAMGQDRDASARPPVAQHPVNSQPLRAVFHLADPGQEPNARGLQNALNAIRALGDEPAQFVLVVHGGALRWFLRTSADHLGAQLAAVLATGKAEWRVCRVTLEQNHWSESQLLPGATVVPSGTLEVLRLEQQGFVYFHP